jgi:imidazolonepropionase-like amidohydrolase
MIAWLALAFASTDCVRLQGDATWLGAGSDLDWIVLSDGKIAATSASALVVPLSSRDGRIYQGQEPCEDVDVTGATVTPGFVAVGGRLGLVEIDMVAEGRDSDGGGPDVRASLVVADAYNPASTAIPVTRKGGVTGSVVFPGGGRVSGQAAYVRTAGDTQAEAVVDSSVAMVADVGGPSRSGGLWALASLFDDARFYARHTADVELGRTRPLAAHPRDLAALLPVLRGELPLVVSADRASDVEALIRFAQAQGVRLVIVGGAEAWVHAEALAEARIAVVVNPTVFGTGSMSQVRARPDNAAVLAAAGVDVILSAGDTHNARLVGQLAGIAVSRGMSREAALRAVTETPRRVFGQEGGRLEVGAPADVVVWKDLDGGTADPFDVGTSVAAVFVAGRSTSLRTRQTELFERYAGDPARPPWAP